MKFPRIINLILIPLFLPLILSAQPSPVNVATWNIRLNTNADGVNAWPLRKERVFEQIRSTDPDILCLQEVLHDQLTDLIKALPRYAWVGAGRDDGKKAGEYVPVFYKDSDFSPLKSGNFWLSEKPDQPGVLGWDAACARMVTWICLIHTKSADTLYIFNTHFDHVGVKAREESAKMLASYSAKIAGKNPVIITGDFNSSPSDNAYKTMFFNGFTDSRPASATAPSGPEYTFTGFDSSKPPGQRIDYIFTRNIAKIESYKVIDTIHSGYYNSDHLMVVTGISVNREP